jgi:glycosyltransferase involved in cell wall biosynthesis
MKVIVISSSPFVVKDNSYYAYSPYVEELEIWAKHSGEISFFCPIWKNDKGLLISKINFPISEIYVAKEFNVKSFSNFIKAFQYSFYNFYKIFQSMLWADHIHLRCPGNISLMACVLQIFFPNKPKTAKYAGNWDPKSKQPMSYRIQKWILNNTFLTRNMQVLVYGTWKNQTKNIKPFYTATYNESDKIPISPRSLIGIIQFIFVGTLSTGKQCLYAIKIVEKLKNLGHNVQLSIYGEGNERVTLENYINSNSLNELVFLKGNQGKKQIMEVYQNSHFLILPSKSEGWPKVVAEAMFWGCLPLATKISCVPDMLDNGNRGILLSENIEQDSKSIVVLLENQELYNAKIKQAVNWSRNYTIDTFENEIKRLLKA